MTIKVIDSIAAHTVEIGDTINLENGETVTVTNVVDDGAVLAIDYIDAFDEAYFGVEIHADLYIDLLGDVDDDEDI